MEAVGELMPSPAIEPILSGMDQPPAMNERMHIDSESLILEVTRYLAAVDAFRTEKCEPTWLPELVSNELSRTSLTLDTGSLASGNHLH